MVQFNVVANERCFRHTHQERALPRTAGRNKQPLGGVLNKKPVPGAKIEEADLHCLGIKPFNSILHARLMRTNVNCAWFARPYLMLPGKNTS